MSKKKKREWKPLRVPQAYDPKADFLTSQGRYWQNPEVWIRITKTHSDFVLLVYLCNQWKLWKLTDRLEDGWFYCTCKTLKGVLKMGRHAQANSLARLEEAGFIKRKKAPPPNGYGKGRDVRWIKIRRKKIHEAALAAWLDPDEPIERIERKATSGKFRRKKKSA